MTPFAPLEGIRVLDFSKVLAGPQCAQYLGELGADVIKVEPIGTGDDTRHWPPFEGGTGSVFLSANRNKRSVALDLKSPEGRAVSHRLAAKADVVIESFGPGVAGRLGIDADALRALNRGLIYCSISGYGTVGPMRERKGYDLMLQAFSGMLALTGTPGGPPARAPFSPVDQATGLHALIGVLAALHERHATGVGQTIEASLFDTSTAFLGYYLQNYWERGTEPQRPGSGHESLCPYDLFETADRPLFLGVASDALWLAFCRLSGLDDLVPDSRYARNADRVARRAEVVADVQQALKKRTLQDWGARFDAAGIPWAPMHTIGDLSRHPHTLESGMVFEYRHPTLGPMKGVAQPLRFDRQRAALHRPPPRLGEHTDAILDELGYSRDHVDAMRAEGTIG